MAASAAALVINPACQESNRNLMAHTPPREEIGMPLLYEKQDHIGVLTLSRPEARNAWCNEFTAGLQERLPELEDDRDIRCVILTGDENGRAFSAGADLKNPRTHTETSVANFLEGIPKRRRLSPISMLADFAKPIVAAVNGYAVGIGCITTFCCDLIVASNRAEWRLPQVALGIMPAQAGALRAARWIGKGMAMRLALGFPLPAEEAYRLGLAQWLVPHADLMPQALKVAEQIAALSPLAGTVVARLGGPSRSSISTSANHGLAITSFVSSARQCRWSPRTTGSDR
jgi:enoyl-CoA hydratase/carnithine racemase